MIIVIINPYVTVIISTYFNVSFARSCFPAPIFCATSAEIVDIIDDGTRNKILIIFSTIPTAAASVSPRWFAKIVITTKDTWMKPSCRHTGIPTFKIFFMVMRFGLKSDFSKRIPLFLFKITTIDTTTLIACAIVVPRAAPAASNPSNPINR